jgi:hypothetical protein
MFNKVKIGDKVKVIINGSTDNDIGGVVVAIGNKYYEDAYQLDSGLWFQENQLQKEKL